MRIRPVLVAVVLASCSDASVVPEQAAPQDTPPPAAPTTLARAEPGSPSEPAVPEALGAFPVREILVAGEVWWVAVADTEERRARGLMEVEDLGGLDGMLFVFAEDTRAAFWMQDTLIPLDIAFFAADGSLVEVLRMEPCREFPCPTYRPARSYRWALEAPAGRLSGLPPEARLAIPGG